MNDLRFYTFDFQLVAVAGDAVSINWSISYNAVGTFEARFAKNSALVALLAPHDYLVVMQGEDSAIITGRTITDAFNLYGRTCNWLLTRRVTPTFKQRTGTPSVLAHAFVEEAFSDVAEMVAGNRCGGEEIKFWRNTYHSVEEVVADCLDRQSLGHRVRFCPDEACWRFDVYGGEERALTLSGENKNVTAVTTQDDCLDYYSGGWFEKVDEDAPESSEWIFVEKDADKTGIYRWECVLSAEDASTAKSDLALKTWERCLRATTKTLRRGTDYHLGDVLRVQLTLGAFHRSARCRVVGTHLWQEAADCGEEPILKEEAT